VAEVGTGADVNLAVTLDLEPDLVLAFGYGTPEYDVEPFLSDAGIPTVLSADYREGTPLGRSEWLKFMALFYNKEAQANDVFAEQALAYDALLALTADVSDRPTVFVNTPFGGTWFIPQGDSYVAKFLADAGADYLWADEPGTGSLFLDFEAVFEQAVAADFWVSPSATWTSLADALAEDERYADFEAFENNVYNNNALVTDAGGNDYWERGVTQPELVLADLIKIFHPELLPDHEFVFYQHLQ
jgi:iron complex transport system substrate-binding protein